MTTSTNWAGNYAYRATAVHRPATLDELRRVVARAPKIRALGTRHAFNDIADSGELVSLEALEQPIEIDRAASSVTVGGGVRYGTLAQALEREGLALHNMASLPHISVAGAVATATHGSGDTSGNLATAVAALELVTSEGDVLEVRRGDPDFEGMVVGLGALGVVTRLTLDVQPSYLVRQQMFERLDWEVLSDRFDEVTSAADSVSLFTDYGEVVNQVLLKERVAPGEPSPLREAFLGAAAATRALHPIADLSADSCTEQLGVPGPWADRLPHFRMGFTPSRGDEIQTEYMVPRRHAVEAIGAVRGLSDRIRPHLWISEIRTVAADGLWLSTAYGTDVVALHFTWKPEPEAVARLLPELEAALTPVAPRPHWGKVFAATAAELEPRYGRMADFRRLAARLDPRGAFRNAYLERVVG